MKLGDAKKITTDKPFVKTDKLCITATAVDGKYKEFKVVYKGVTKTFPVKNYNILAAWKQVENYTKDILK